jgi:hypothetical protein
MAVNPIVRSRLEAQGFCGLNDEALDELAPWMRWTDLSARVPGISRLPNRNSTGTSYTAIGGG